MNRSGSQKFLLVVSIINIVFGALAVIMGLLAMTGGAVIGAVNTPEVTSAFDEAGMAQSTAAALVMGGSMLIIITSVIDIVIGILGVRAANDNQKIMPVWVLCLIDLVLTIIGVIVSLVQNGSLGSGSSMLSNILSIAMTVLMFYAANNIKREAGK
ncbi:MAG: hypothetical protein Q4B54_10550 [Coriobacteriales bacterium]|nr:hypothetical protein [Coriobacteriales bacterium]